MSKRKGNGHLARDEVSEGLRRKLEEYETARQLFVDRVRDILRDSKDESLLPIVQEAWGLGMLDDDVGFFLVVRALEEMTESESWIVYQSDFAAKYAELYDKYDVDPDEGWAPGTEPEDAAQLSSEYEAVVDRIFLAMARKHGELQIARLYQTDRAQFDTKRETGRSSIFGPKPSPEEFERMVAGIEESMGDRDSGDSPESD